MEATERGAADLLSPGSGPLASTKGLHEQPFCGRDLEPRVALEALGPM